MNSKHCPYCHFNTETIKFGVTSSKRQRYRCKTCKRTWTSKPHPQILAKNIWYDMVFRNMNMHELARKYKMSERNVRRKLDLYEPPEIVPNEEDKSTTVIAMDVTYFGRSWGILTALNVHTGKPLYSAPTRGYEAVWDYEQAIIFLHKYGIEPKAVIIDGKKGVIEMLEDYGMKVQFCQFHQLKIITQCLTRKPILEPNIVLRNIALSLTHTKYETFERALYIWKMNNELWLRERTKLENSKWEYTHKLTRRAINSLIHNLPYLFTFEKYPELNIPNTNNRIEGLHSDLKRRLSNHRGLKKEQKIHFIRIFLSGGTGV